MAETLIQPSTGEDQANGTVTTTQEGQRSFTQEELNSIVSDRLRRESAKYSDYEELKQKAQKLDEIEESSKSELQKATEKANELQTELDKIKRRMKSEQLEKRYPQKQEFLFHFFQVQLKKNVRFRQMVF